MATNYPHYPISPRKPTKGNDVWSSASPLNEARALLEMYKRGLPVDAIRALIRVTEKERVELQEFARENPALAKRIETCIAYRGEVEEIFDRLVRRSNSKEKAA